MADYKVKKIEEPINATVCVPGSKSITNRALFISALSDGKCKLNGVLFSDDSRVFIKALQDLGFILSVDEAGKCVEITGAKQADCAKESRIYVGSAGTAARFLTAYLAFSDGEYFIDASEQMKKRPMLPLFEALEELGAEIMCKEEEGFLPITIKGCFHAGADILSSFATVDSDASTQFLSALLMMAPGIANRTEKDFRIKVTGSRAMGSYVKMTIKVMSDFGANVTFTKETDEFCIQPSCSYDPREYDIEPDVSAACYFYAAAALTGGEVTVKGVYRNSCQGDIRFLSLLEEMGCALEDTKEGIRLSGPEDGLLHGISVNMQDFSDQTMTLAAIAPFCDAPVEITGIGHIRGQESDRIKAVATELKRLGIEVCEGQDSLKIYPGKPQAAQIETYNDHRMAMAFALVGLRAEGIIIKNCECCKKTFEEYFEVFDNMDMSNAD